MIKNINKENILKIKYITKTCSHTAKCTSICFHIWEYSSLNKSSFYNYPLNSELIGIYKVSNLSKEIKTWPLKELK